MVKYICENFITSSPLQTFNILMNIMIKDIVCSLSQSIFKD